MYTTYHFKSVADINTDILEAIKIAFRGKSVSITVKEERDNDRKEDTVPARHKDLVLQRLNGYNEDKTQALDFDRALDDIEKEL